MDYEKAYKAVLQTATQWIKDGCTDKEKICLECVFPELAESEDERARKDLITYLKSVQGETLDLTLNVPKWIAYLEKQKDLFKYGVGCYCYDGNTTHFIGAPAMEELTPIEETCKESADFFTDEDENIRQALISLVSNDKKNGYTEFYKAQEITCDKVIAFLKKLKQLPTNEEMLRTLRAEYEKGVADTIAKYEQKEQKPKDRFEEAREKYQVEWSEEDEKMRVNILNALTPQLVYSVGKGTYTGTSTYKYDDEIKWLKSLRPQPIQLKEAYKEGFQTARHATALAFMNYLDKNRPDGKMSLSSGECEDIDKAFKEGDWAKIIRYYEKYHSSWKPSEEQMEALESAVKLYKDTHFERFHIRIESLYEQLKNLM